MQFENQQLECEGSVQAGEKHLWHAPFSLRLSAASQVCPDLIWQSRGCEVSSCFRASRALLGDRCCAPGRCGCCCCCRSFRSATLSVNGLAVGEERRRLSFRCDEPGWHGQKIAPRLSRRNPPAPSLSTLYRTHFAFRRRQPITARPVAR